MSWTLLWLTLDTWMPNLMALIKAIPTIFDAVINFEYKRFLLSVSYLYYYTVFFWAVRVVIFCGVTFVNLINYKFTTSLKKKTVRNVNTVLLKNLNTNFFKVNFLQVALIIYL